MPATRISPEDYQAFKAFLEQSCGIVLGDNKQYLVTSRLNGLMLRHGVGSLGELVARLRQHAYVSLRGQVIEAMTTNETQWFRDIYPFAILQNDLFPRLQAKRSWQIRLWSAGCSSGQEAYSMSIALQEFNARGGRLEAQILGTDISPAMIDRATAGRYPLSVINRGLTPERRDTYCSGLDENTWEVNRETRRRTSFRVHNLLESFALLGRFDIIFCRNVLIYFSTESRHDIISRMARVLNPGGFLVLGASESLARHAHEFETVRCQGGVVYQLKT